MADPIVVSRGGGAAPKVSVAVSSRNRSHLLKRLIACLEAQTIAPESFEVVIVDDASTDDTPETLSSLVRTTSLRLTTARLCERSGPAIGRNAAWRLARGEIIAFTDDDCQPSPGWLEHGLAALAGGADIVVGRVTPDPEQLHLIGPFSRTMHVHDARYLATCNIFYGRSDVEAVGGFDESFPSHAAGGEDTDLGWRVRQQLRRRIAFEEKALVLHDVRASKFVAKVKDTLRWTGIPRLVALHPEEGRRILHRRLFWKDTHPAAILAVVGISLTLRSPVAAILALPWIRMRARRIGSRRWLHALPGLLAIDALEVAVMLRASLRNRTVVL